MATFAFSFSTDLLLLWLSELNSNSLKFNILCFQIKLNSRLVKRTKSMDLEDLGVLLQED
jgi:hypothetical protein